MNFNYDRSLEHYLYWALQDEALVPDDVARESIGSLTVIRPYGCVGPLRWQNREGIDFGEGSERAPELSRSIKTFTEQHDSQTQWSIDNALEAAQLIVILGFGFHPQNLELLGSRQLERRSRLVYATVTGIASENHGFMRDRLMRNIETENVAQFLDKTAAELLRDLRIAIMAAAN